MAEVQALTHCKMATTKDGFAQSKSIIPARELYICWIEDPRYWVWTHLKDCNRTEVAELLEVCWLDIKGKLDVKHLPACKTFGAYLVFKLREKSYGLEHVKTSVTFVNDVKGDCEDAEGVTACLDNKKQANACAVVPHLRTDGWMEIKLGEFYKKCGDHGELEMRLFNTNSNWKSGLLVKEIEVRPTS